MQINEQINEWTVVWRTNQFRSNRKIYHTNKDCPILNINKKVRESRMGSMVAGKFRKCYKCPNL